VTVGFGEEEYMTVPERRAAAMGHKPRDTPASFWHICRNPACGDLAWADHDPRPVPCWNCGHPTPQGTLSDMNRHVQARGSEACPSLNGEHTDGTLY
jgi:hypothetical protein